MSDTHHVLVERPADGVATVTLDRPDRLNAVTGETLAALDGALRSLGEDPDCRAVVLRGAGRAFCAGMDLTRGLTLPRDGADSVQARYTAMRRAVAAIATMREIPQPVIAAVHGHAVGAGFALAAAADIRICAPDTTFDAVMVKIGVSGGDLGLSWMLPRLIGPGHTAELLYTGGALTAAAAERHGLVQRVVDDPTAVARDLAATIAAMPPGAVQMTKELLNASLGGLRDHLELELRSQVIGLSTRVHLDAVGRFASRSGKH